ESASEGSTITFVIDEEYGNNPEDVVYRKDSKEKETIHWLDRLAELHEKYGDNYTQTEEFQAEVPIKAIDDKGDTLFYLHTEDWIQHQNVETTDEGIIEQKELIRKMRKVVLSEGSTQ